MRNVIIIVLSTLFLLGCKPVVNGSESITLKTALDGKFLIGVAVNEQQFTGEDTAAVSVITRHFNSVVAENCMKCEIIHPEEDRFDFTQSDRFVEFGEANRMVIIGHTLIWHSQLAPWFCVDENGQNVSREVLTDRMKRHITTIVERYKGRIKGWDVVNEAFEDDGSYRKSKFYEILGEDYIPLAFRFAQEADPDAELYYNDYSLAHSAKRDAVVKLIQSLKEQGLRIDAVGMQGHMQMNFPAPEDFEQSMLAFAEAGTKVMITEWDLTVLPFPDGNVGADVAATFEYKEAMNPYKDQLPDSVAQAWTARASQFFGLFLKHQDIITRVTVWGLSDKYSWRNSWPIRGRTDYPLLFDRDYQPKALVDSIINKAINFKKK